MEPSDGGGSFDPSGLIGSGIADVGSTLGGVAGPAVGIAAALLALTFGWSLVRRFVS